MRPEISVIIPALNEEKYIGHALDGLRKQTFRSFETIVVDGGSIDSTRKIVGKHAKMIVEKRKGAAAARNSGAKVARGSILLFLDADTRPSPSLLQVYSRTFRDKGIIDATGPIIPLEKTNPIVSAGYRFVSVLFVHLSILAGRPSIVGANFAVRKEAFEKARGFNPRMITYEDWDLSLRLRRYGKSAFLKDAVVYTSIRRISEWGMGGFFRYYTGNMARYTLFKKPKKNYKAVR